MAEKDSRLTEIDEWYEGEDQALDNTYGAKDENGNWTGGLIGSVDSQYNDAVADLNKGTQGIKDATEQQLNATISGIELNKQDAHTDYIKEQSGAYVDYMKQTAKHGVNAEKMASSGLTNSGYAESSMVSMYNQYQSRVSAAHTTYQRIVADYNQAIAEAKAQNSLALAQIEYDSLKERLTLMLEGFQYKNNLILEATKAKRELNAQKHSRYMDVYDLIHKEETLRQQREIADAQLAEERRQFNILHPTIGSGSGGSGGGSGNTSSNSVNKSKVGTVPVLAPTKENVAVLNGALTKAQWDKLRAFYVTTGTGNAAVTNYDTYEEYARDFNKYKQSSK